MELFKNQPIRSGWTSMLLLASLVMLAGCGLQEGFDTKDKSTELPSEQTPTPGSFYSWGVTNNQRVYFSGHSLMDNPLPDFLNHLALNQSRNHQWNQHNVIGSPMRVRVGNNSHTGFAGWISSGKSKNGNAINVIDEVRNPTMIGAGNKYNALILTERHDLLGVLMWEGTIPFLRLYTDFYNQTNPTRVFWYHSWLDINKANPSLWLNYEAQAQKIWECSAARVNMVYQSQSSPTRILNLPVGGALVDLVQKILADQISGFTGSQTAKLDMLFRDSVHNTDIGMYYLSILNYIALYGLKPTSVSLPSGYDLSSISQTAVLNGLIDHAWTYLNTYYNSGSKDHTMAQCRNFGPAFCTAKQSFDGTAYNSCVNDINYVFSSSTEPDWKQLPN